MNIEQLQYICMVAKTNSITVAAENLFVTQQTISKAVNKLEMELDVKLLTRSYKGVKLTEKGHVFVDKASNIVKEFQDLYLLMREGVHQDVTGTLRIYETSYTSHTVGLNLLSNLYRLYPELNIHIDEMLAVDVLKQIAESKDEVGLIPLINDSCGAGKIQDYAEHLDWEEIYYEHLMIYVSMQNPLAEEASASLKNIVKYPLVWGDCPGFEVILRQDYHLDPKILINSTSSTLHDKAVAENMAVGFTSELLARDKERDENAFKMIPIKEKPKLVLVMIKPKGYQLNKLQALFIEETKKAFQGI